MSFLSKLFRRSSAQASGPGEEDPLVPVPIPPLGILLLNLEREKGAPLTEQEVLSARDNAVCMMLPLSRKRALDEKRGYEDIDPENVWLEWKAFQAEAHRNPN